MNQINESESGNKSTQLKITLPDSLVEKLDAYCNTYSISKSEIIKNTIFDAMRNDVSWNKAFYFFKPNNVEKGMELLNAKVGRDTLIKVACCEINMPINSSIYICNLLKISGRTVFFSIPNYFGNTTLTNDSTGLSLDAGKLVIPKNENQGMIWNPNLVYELDISYIWDFDLTPVKHNFTTTF